MPVVVSDIVMWYFFFLVGSTVGTRVWGRSRLRTGERTDRVMAFSYLFFYSFPSFLCCQYFPVIVCCGMWLDKPRSVVDSCSVQHCSLGPRDDEWRDASHIDGIRRETWKNGSGPPLTLDGWFGRVGRHTSGPKGYLVALFQATKFISIPRKLQGSPFLEVVHSSQFNVCVSAVVFLHSKTQKQIHFFSPTLDSLPADSLRWWLELLRALPCLRSRMNV